MRLTIKELYPTASARLIKKTYISLFLTINKSNYVSVYMFCEGNVFVILSRCGLSNDSVKKLLVKYYRKSA